VAKQSAGATDSATGKVLAHNSSEEDQLCSRSREDMLIYVLNHKVKPFCLRYFR